MYINCSNIFIGKKTVACFFKKINIKHPYLPLSVTNPIVLYYLAQHHPKNMLCNEDCIYNCVMLYFLNDKRPGLKMRQIFHKYGVYGI